MIGVQGFEILALVGLIAGVISLSVNLLIPQLRSEAWLVKIVIQLSTALHTAVIIGAGKTNL